MSINLADNNPRIEYTVAEGVTQTSFSVPFEFFDDSDVVIYVDGTLKTEGVDYTLTGGDGATGTAALSVTGASGGSTVVITRRIALERVTDFTAGSDINRAALNQQLDTLVAMVADANDRIDRSIHMPDEDPTDVNFALPAKADRISKYLAFGADGDIALTSGTTSNIVVSTFAETFIDDSNGAEVIATLGLTATIAELNTLDGITATVTELNYTDGVTSNIQTQLDAKQGLDATLTALAGLSTGANKIPYSTGTDTFGQLDFIDDDTMATATATNVSSSEAVKAYVDAAVLPATGAVGSYAFLGHTDSTVTINPGDEIAGSLLRYAGVQKISNWTSATSDNLYAAGGGGTPSGTWRAMGYAVGSSGTRFAATLFLRIS